MNSHDTQELMDKLFLENNILREELKVSRKASVITAKLVSRQFSKTEDVLFRLEEQLKKASAKEKELAKEKRRLENMQIASINMMEDLEISRKLANAATQAKSDFLANMSHEIRTPMNAVIGLAHLTLQTELTVKQSGYLKNIRVSANALLGIINDILDFSKIEAGQLDIESIPFEVSEVMNNLANIASVSAENKDIEVLFRISKNTPPWLRGDPLRLGQILINLTNNAIKFTSKGEVVISFNLVKEEEKHVTLQFSVKDTGIGMTPEQQSKLFTAFSQADTSTTRKFGGTGLGLSISKRLVEMMGGEISMQSKIGHGSTFSCTLTFGRQEPLKKETVSDGEVLEKLRILVVDDNSTARTILENMLSNMGVKEISLASSGLEAIAAIESTADKEQPYDLVLMDWKMPQMDGAETIRKIKAIKTLAALPAIIMVTAYGHDHVRKQATKDSLAGFLVKPITPHVLLDTMSQALWNLGTETNSPEKFAADITAGLQGKYILVVEDNLINQQVAQELLENAGIRVELAENGIQAIRRLKNSANCYDAILMDMQMPEMDGLEATRRIRTDLEMIKLPIIAMTANVMQSDIDACLTAGMDDFIAKPIDVEKLFNTLKKWLPSDDTVLETAGDIQVIEKNSHDELPEEIAGIDLQNSLLRLGGNKRLLRKLLLEFRLNGQTMYDQTLKALDNEEWQEAQLQAHSIKGVAGNLGISAVQDISQKLELALKENSTKQYETLSRDLQREVKMAVLALEVLEQEEVDTTSPHFNKEEKNIDKVSLAVTIGKMREMLVKNNLAAGKAFEELQQQLADTDVEIILSEIDSRIIRLDFNGAIQALSDLTRALEISIDEESQ